MSPRGGVEGGGHDGGHDDDQRNGRGRTPPLKTPSCLHPRSHLLAEVQPCCLTIEGILAPARKMGRGAHGRELVEVDKP